MGSGSGNPGGSGPGGLGIPSISGTGPSSLDGDLGNPGGGLGSNHSFSGAQVLLGDDQGLNGSHNATSSQITLHVRPSMCMLRPRGLVGAQ